MPLRSWSQWKAKFGDWWPPLQEHVEKHIPCILVSSLFFFFFCNSILRNYSDRLRPHLKQECPVHQAFSDLSLCSSGKSKQCWNTRPTLGTCATAECRKSIFLWTQFWRTVQRHETGTSTHFSTRHFKWDSYENTRIFGEQTDDAV